MINVDSNKKNPDISIVLPCYNEEKNIEIVIKTIIDAFKSIRNLNLEVIIVDNNSEDKSQLISKKLINKYGKDLVRLVIEKKQGYGNALHAGFINAKGNIFAMADMDRTYEYKKLPLMYSLVKNGKYDMVIGNRLKGNMEKGAMPWLHRFIGSPLISFLINLLFPNRIYVSDTQSGMRVFSRKIFENIVKISEGSVPSGMPYASWIIIQSSKIKPKIKIKEVITDYYSRQNSESKLSTFSDGWKIIKFISVQKFQTFKNK